MLRSLEERLFAHVRIGTLPEHAPELGVCLLWTGAVNERGYGRINGGDGSTRRVHRVAFELVEGALSDLHVLHRCDVPNCVRFSHLKRGTQRENNGEMAVRKRSRNGHGRLDDSVRRRARELYAEGVPVARIEEMRSICATSVYNCVYELRRGK